MLKVLELTHQILPADSPVFTWLSIKGAGKVDSSTSGERYINYADVTKLDRIHRHGETIDDDFDCYIGGHFLPAEATASQDISKRTLRALYQCMRCPPDSVRHVHGEVVEIWARVGVIKPSVTIVIWIGKQRTIRVTSNHGDVTSGT